MREVSLVSLIRDVSLMRDYLPEGCLPNTGGPACDEINFLDQCLKNPEHCSAYAWPFGCP